MTDQPLGLSEDIDLTKDDAEKLRYIEAYDLTMEVDTAVEEGMIPEELAETAELELKRFLAIAYLEREDRESLVPGRRIDTLWHKFILNTPSYTRFCDRVYGEYLHHVPSRVEDRAAVPEERRGTSLAGQYFDDFADEFWIGPILCIVLNRL